jgi:LacI family transcriptional regulator
VSSRPTLHEVASFCGLSFKTVSRVVNGDANVAPATAERVLQAIAELGYRPNLVARSLRVGRDNVIGLVVASIGDPFFADVTTAVEERARDNGFFVIISSTGENSREEETVISGLLARQVAGMILVPTSADQGYLRAQQSAVPPLVCVDRPPVGIECDTVLVDNELAAFGATNWLLSHGHRRIGFVGGPADKFTIRLRRLGYERALEQAGIPVDPETIDDSVILPTQVRVVVPRLLSLDRPVTAILTSNAKASMGVMGALHLAKRTDVALVGFDDFPAADALVPPVTVVSQNAVHIGHVAVELLLKRLAGTKEPCKRLVLPTTLIPRGSGEIPPSTPTGALERSRSAVL